ncbi:MAG: hypothetical protein Q7S66_03155 [bacterium]|nr:hypothetical protein [bacterium]
MNKRREDAHRKAHAQSFANQESRRTIPAKKLGRIVRIRMGFQPFGITSSVNADGTDKVLIANYYGPAIVRTIVSKDEAGLHFAVNHIRGAEGSMRCFPDVQRGANRMQVAVRHPNGDVLVLRNGDDDFYALRLIDGGGFRFEGKFDIAVHKVNQMVHSAAMVGDLLVTIESEIKAATADWCRRVYGPTEDDQLHPIFGLTGDDVPSARWRYGIAASSDPKKHWTVTDFRSEEKHGVYLGDDLVVPGICGSGLAILTDGSMLVSVYGESFPEPFNGRPGELVYIPAALLK